DFEEGVSLDALDVKREAGPLGELRDCLARDTCATAARERRGVEPIAIDEEEVRHRAARERVVDREHDPFARASRLRLALREQRRRLARRLTRRVDTRRR